jgi:hypothetical protein
MDSNLDLDLNNYDLVDILKLFNLQYNFTKDDLKKAKKIVLMTHPDKSKLDKSVFLFYTSAYKIIYKLYEFRYKSQQSTEYTVEKNRENESILNKLNLKHGKEFNKWFNEMFEKERLKNEFTDGGYGDWISSNEDIDTRKTTKENMNLAFETKKKEISSLVVRQGISELKSNNFSDLTNDRPQSYSSDVFSKFCYEDLKVAHTETVVPVTNDDYMKIKKYNTINELQTDRSKEIKPLSYDQSKKYLDTNSEIESKRDMERAYRLARLDEEAKKINNNWWSKLKQLTI